MSQTATLFLVIGLFLLFFPTLWLAITLLLSGLGGWHTLAKKYRETTPFQGTLHGGQKAMFGIVSYKHVLTVGTNQYGMHLSTFILFRAFHPPLFIPWPDITSAPTKLAWFSNLARLTFRQAPSISVILF